MNDPESIMVKVKRVVQDNQTAVLCVQEAGEPFGYLIAIAFNDDLKFVVFGTPKESRKSRLLTDDGHVALVVDNRPQKGKKTAEVEVFTAIGVAKLVTSEPDRKLCQNLLKNNHPDIGDFIDSPLTEFFQVDMNRYIYVSNFQDVVEWIP
jgi:hypothetical protein